MAIDKKKDPFEHLRELLHSLPGKPGVYLMKDSQGRVLYVGKAANLRDRVASYFQPSADLLQSRGPRIAEMVHLVTDITVIPAESEVDAILHEARLIKDIQPPYNTRLTDDKTFPYLEITTHEPFPRVLLTRNPHPKSRLYGPFTQPRELRRVIQILQRIFRFRTCTLEISEHDDKRRFFRPCILHSLHQCTAPCADRISKQDYRNGIRRLQRFLESKRATVLRRWEREMKNLAENREYEEAARLRDEIRAIEALDDRGEVDQHVQPELFQVDPREGLDRLTHLLGHDSPIRVIEGIDIAHIMGHEAVGALVCFIDGRPFKPGYRRFRIKTIEGIDDFAMIAEVLTRRLKRLGEPETVRPDLILIDGGLGQLNAALTVVDGLADTASAPAMLSLAKQEETIFTPSHDGPLQLKRNDPALRLLQYIRDEAHRFAQHYFHILQRKELLGPDSGQ